MRSAGVVAGTVVACGLATVQDGGRLDHVAVGVPVSGPLHVEWYEAAATLLAGAETAGSTPTVEVLVGPLVVEVAGATPAVVVGPAGCHVEAQGRTKEFAPHVVVLLAAGDRLVVEPAGHGPVYVGIGGWAPPVVLGSAATDTFSRLGGAVVVAGFALRGGGPVDLGRVGAYWRPVPEQVGPVRVLPGADGSITGRWRVEAVSRSGIRLRPVASDVARPDGVGHAGAVGSGVGSGVSRPVVTGTIQRTPDGGAIVLGPDGGVTGGYPVAGVVATVDLDRLSLLAPGDETRLATISVPEAIAAATARRAAVRRGFGHPDLAG